jgi:hypothetical protein
MGGIPNMWKPFWFADLAFLVLFAWSWAVLGTGRDVNIR